MSVAELTHQSETGWKKSLEGILNSTNWQIHEIETVADWYGETGRGKERFRSRTGNIILEELMKVIPQTFVNSLSEKLRYELRGKDLTIILDHKFSMKPIRPYVEFVKEVNGIQVSKLKINFRINSDVELSEIKVDHDSNNRPVLFGKIKIFFVILMVSTGSYELDKPTELGRSHFIIDLTNFYM